MKSPSVKLNEDDVIGKYENTAWCNNKRSYITTRWIS